MSAPGLVLYKANDRNCTHAKNFDAMLILLNIPVECCCIARALGARMIWSTQQLQLIQK